MRPVRSLLTIAGLVTLGACASSPPPAAATPPAREPEPPAAVESQHMPTPPPNPIDAEWGGPYGGLPPFDKVKVPDFAPALATAMADALAAIDRIANDPAPP